MTPADIAAIREAEAVLMNLSDDPSMTMTVLILRLRAIADAEEAKKGAGE